jgi:RNA polymerase sigma-70 factor (ECF subfamily)
VADSVGLALLVVLETLGPSARLAFVLHDMFAVSFDEIAPIVRRSPSAGRQLASRARRRVQGVAKAPDADLACQREVVDAFLAAARGGDIDALLAVLDPDVVLRANRGGVPPRASRELHGARTVAEQALAFARLVEFARPVLVNGTAGIVSGLPGGQPFSVMGFTVRRRRIVEINILVRNYSVSNLPVVVFVTGKFLERNRSSSRSRAAMMPQSNTAHTKAQSEPKASGVARIINTPPQHFPI